MSGRGRAAVEPSGKSEARRCRYDRCGEVFVTTDATRGYCSPACRREALRRQGDARNDGAGESSDGIFSNAEHATWSANLDTLKARVVERQKRGPLRKVVARRGEIDVLECGDEIPDEERKALESRRCGACFVRERSRPSFAALAETARFVSESL